MVNYLEVELIPEKVILALTLWAECRGENEVGQICVAHSILNRVALQKWYGKSIREVCLKSFQFSCWNLTDYNLDYFKKLFHKMMFGKFGDLKKQLNIITGCMSCTLSDITEGATHYYSTLVYNNLDKYDVPSGWGNKDCYELKCEIGNHRFYKEL